MTTHFTNPACGELWTARNFEPTGHGLGGTLCQSTKLNSSIWEVLILTDLQRGYNVVVNPLRPVGIDWDNGQTIAACHS